MDKVNHPNHYCREGRRECIDEMYDLFGCEAVKYFCVLNAYKYMYRCGLKGDADEDRAKAKWYSDKYLELGGDKSELAKIKD